MTTVIISDIHIGSRYLNFEPLKSFLVGLPVDAELILNGDTVDRRRFRVLPHHQQALDLLQEESQKRRVVWVWGNHDWKYRPPKPGNIEFVRDYSIGRSLFLAHGHQFDFIMPVARPLLNLIRMVHDHRVDRGGEFVHVAFAAKKFDGLYKVLRDHVSAGAVKFARKNGYEAIACGHTHFVEDRKIDGVRYLNTGSWTEQPISCLYVDSVNIELRRIN